MVDWESAYYMGCHAFSYLHGFPGCCGSCHVDEEDYGYPLSGPIAMPWHGMVWEVCCAVNNFVETLHEFDILQAAMAQHRYTEECYNG